MSRPAVTLAALGVLLGAVGSVSLLDSDAWAFTGLAGHRSTGKPGHSAAPAAAPSSSSASTSAGAGAAPSATPSAADTAGQAAAPAPSTDSPAAELPPVNTPTPTPTPTPSTTPSPSATPPDTATPSPTSSDTRSAPTTQVAPAGWESNRVGALFSGSVGPGNHFCTASVLHSPAHDLILTAAHCVSSANGVSFVPGYRNGQAPYGSWQATKLYTTNGWSQNGDVDQDFAILQVAPNSAGQRIEDVVGGFDLGLNEPFTATVRLYGYPDTTDQPILCSNATTQQSAYQRRIDCPSYPAGTSGGPWISTATGKVIGVIGGYQQGGNTDDTSYSAYFDSTIGKLYQLATSS
ncbi:trypsin-like serine peptidase [Kitasatospora sp. NPDC006697]|uniref:trypsin-like serine peptidase n=1 Tax=Kitasatospora sp. NPDC006697 TaxID=3364020 RepID=UPI003684A7BA